jgi:hypothetical protein
MAMVVVVVARHESKQARSQACDLSGQGINVESEKREPRQQHPPVNHGTKEWRKVDGRTPVQVNADHTLHL